MKFTFSSLVIAALLVAPHQAFVLPPTASAPFATTTTALSSSLAVDDTAQMTKSEPPASKGGISMSVDELALTLGGRGRARLAWDCYQIGIDPALFYGKTIQLGHDDFETVLELLPSNRRSQRIGPDALRKLASSYANADQVEGGVASLSFVSQSSDKTTKLLLSLADGLSVETVIIPWKGQRSTLCISSQVGCRQVRVVSLFTLLCLCVSRRPFGRVVHAKGC